MEKSILFPGSYRRYSEHSYSRDVETQSSRAIIHPGFMTYRPDHIWVPTGLGENWFLPGRTENPV